MSDNTMTCARWDELLQDHLEGELDVAVRPAFDSHAATCARCQRLLRDLGAITMTARELPELEPSQDLWAGIASRIEPEVVSIGSRRDFYMGVPRLRLAAAAAALVVLTSGVTYVATSRSLGESRVAAAPSSAPTPVALAEPEVGATERAPASTAPSERVAAVEPARSAAPAAPVRARGVTVLPVSETERALQGEISQLQQLLSERRTALDPATVRIVEDNLALIDAAVREARNALAADPASGFLSGQLDNALQKKVRLLRTVALLPSTT